VPYLPIDPADLGRSYDAVIRVNSQSGKGGMAYLLEQEFGLALPRRLQIEFSRVVQQLADSSGREIAASDIHALFVREYLEQEAPYRYASHRMSENTRSDDSAAGEPVQVEVTAFDGHVQRALRGAGNGPIDAFVNALGLDVRLMDYHEHAIGSGANARAACYVELRVGNGPTLFGAAIDSNIVTASFKAVLSAVNRHIASAPESVPALAA
jgi:2-isopropylmalate synthase